MSYDINAQYVHMLIHVYIKILSMHKHLYYSHAIQAHKVLEYNVRYSCSMLKYIKSLKILRK